MTKVIRASDLSVNSYGFRDAISGFENVRKSIVKLNILGNGNRVLKTLWIHSEIWWIFMQKLTGRENLLWTHMVFETRFLLYEMLSFPIGKLNILENENRVQKLLGFAMNSMTFHGIPWKLMWFGCSWPRFLNAIFVFQNVKFSNWKT